MNRNTTHSPTTVATTRIASLLAAVAMAIWGAGCSAPANPARDCLTQPLPPAPGALIVLVGVHANTPAPALPAPAAPILQATLAAGNPVKVVAVDGTPSTLPISATMTVARSTCDTFDTDLAVATNAVIDTITAATADSDGDNLFAAMDMAGRTIAAGGWSNATILVIDSGLAERPNSPINFAQPGMTSLNDDQITAAADFATTNQPLDLKGVTVAFHGLAATAAPQPSLSPAEAQVIAKLWVEIAKNAGADSVTAVPTPRTGPGPQTRYITTVIPPADVSTFEPPTPGNPTRAKFGEEDIHFAFDSATITDPGAATAKLAQLTAWLADDPTHRVQLRGRTDSSGTPGHNEDLAGRRATSVKALILTADPRISPSQISTFADGESFKGALPDTRPDGSLDPIPAAMNRHVLAMATTD